MSSDNNQLHLHNEESFQNSMNLNVNSINNNTNLKNLYQSIGTRVSRLREINEEYEKKIKTQNSDLLKLDEKIKQKEDLLNQIRFHKSNLTRGFSETQLEEMKDTSLSKFYNKDKLKVSIKASEDFFNQKYDELLLTNNLSMKINENHIQNDPSIKKIYIEKERELSELQNKLNSIVRKTETVKKEIDGLRLENYKNTINLNDLMTRKSSQSQEMEKISNEANRYLKEKENVNKELVDLNEKIDSQKVSYDNKMKELNKMIENTKKMKEFHETLAVEKFSKTSTNMSNNYNNYNNNEVNINKMKKSVNIIDEENKVLFELENQLKAKKKISVHMNFNRFILMKKQNMLKEIIKKVKTQTGIESLDKLSDYLELSSKTNKLFENDLHNLNEQKMEIERKIEEMKGEIKMTQEKVNDCSTEKFEYIEKLRIEMENEEKNKETYNRKLYTLNRLIDIISKAFQEICRRLSIGEEDDKPELSSSEELITRCMDVLEKKINQIVQLNQDPIKDNKIEEMISTDEKNSNKLSLIQKTMENIYNEESIRNFYVNKSVNVSNGNELKVNAKNMVENYMKKFADKINIG